ncbi:sugar transferase [Pseudomonadales bacterium]|nr:sugar transferase [Pseudomonadales bacterium]
MYKKFGKRVFDVVLSLLILIPFSPILMLVLLAVWISDRKSPFYLAPRVGQNNLDFTMIKIRSMKVDADKSGVNSTSSDDVRVTRVGHFIRRFKLDEVSQFLNVIQGSMSVIGPRPNTREWGVDLYSDEEMKLLNVKPGITDFASIVFSDEGDILLGKTNPDLHYNEFIRPWKSRLSLLNIRHSTLVIDVQLCLLTFISVFARKLALRKLNAILCSIGCSSDLLAVATRDSPLSPINEN